MTRFVLGISPVVALLLASVGTASAVCGWVLWVEGSWREPTGDRGTEWIIVTAHAREDACRTEAESKIKQLSRRGTDDPDDLNIATQNNIISKRFGAGDTWRLLTTERVVCLPDSIDPRGPKVK